MLKISKSEFSNPKQYPKIAVLLASYQGEDYIRTQIQSILDQQHVDVHLYVSDDGSTDKTLEVVGEFAPAKIAILPFQKCGSAARNFFYLLKTVSFEDYDFVALADQDDIWLHHKLSRAVTCLDGAKADAYSSDVIAFWSSGKTRYIRKSNPLTEFDYVFEAGGPGCTHVYTSATAHNIQAFLRGSQDNDLESVALHDWLIYALCRNKGMAWVIDDHATMRYRQHDTNVFGAPSGFRAIVARLKLVFSGWYFQEASQIINVISYQGKIRDILSKPSFGHLLFVLRNVTQFRRKKTHSLFVTLILLINIVLGRLRRKSL